MTVHHQSTLAALRPVAVQKLLQSALQTEGQFPLQPGFQIKSNPITPHLITSMFSLSYIPYRLIRKRYLAARSWATVAE